MNADPSYLCSALLYIFSATLVMGMFCIASTFRSSNSISVFLDSPARKSVAASWMNGSVSEPLKSKNNDLNDQGELFIDYGSQSQLGYEAEFDSYDDWVSTSAITAVLSRQDSSDFSFRNLSGSGEADLFELELEMNFSDSTEIIE